MVTKVLSSEKKSRKKVRSFSVKIRHDLAQAIHDLATKRQVQAETLVNNILEEHLTPQPQSDTEFLFSLGGMFSSEPADTSENVRAEVAEYLKKKYDQSEI